VTGEIVSCPHCRTQLEVAGRLRGALLNCTKCGRVVEVPGLRDPLWLLLRLAALALGLSLVWLLEPHWGPWGAAAAGAGTVALLWLLSRAL
jgi:hypothetical protein